MLIVSLVVILALFFAGMIFLLQKLFKQNVVSATSHLEGMASEYAKKEEEIKKQFEDLKRQSQEILGNAQKDAQAQREQLLKEAQEQKDKLLGLAQAKADEMLKQADGSCQVLVKEMQEKIEEAATRRAVQLLEASLPDNIREKIHQLWIDEVISGGLKQLDRLRVSEAINEAEVLTAFALSGEQRGRLSAKISEKLGRQVALNEKISPEMIAGLVVSVGSLVFDGSLRFKIQEAARVHQSGR